MSYNRENKGKREEDDLIEKLVSINRVAKVVKGGRRFGFAALVVVGDGQGRVGIGSNKAREVPEAIRKASAHARKVLLRIPLREGRTLHHDILGKFGRGIVLMRSAPPGTGIIAGGPVRAVFEALGVSDVVAKSIGSSNPHNMVKAALDGLKRSSSPRRIAQRRGKKVSEIVRDRNLVQSKTAEAEETDEDSAQETQQEMAKDMKPKHQPRKNNERKNNERKNNERKDDSRVKR